MTALSTRRLAAALGSTLIAATIAACGGNAPAAAPSVGPSAAPTTAAAEPSTVQSTEPSVAPAETPGESIATTGRIALADKGFAVTLPDGWTRIDLAADDIDQLIEAAGNANPDLAGIYSAQIKAMLASGLVLFAFGPNPLDGTNVNILAVPSSGLSLDLLEAANVAQIKAMAKGDVLSERVTLPAGEALHLRYQISAAGAPTAPSIDQYLLLTPKNQLMISVTNGPKGAAKKIAESIEVL